MIMPGLTVIMKVGEMPFLLVGVFTTLGIMIHGTMVHGMDGVTHGVTVGIVVGTTLGTMVGMVVGIALITTMAGTVAGMVVA